jgi:hypothetical protein
MRRRISQEGSIVMSLRFGLTPATIVIVVGSCRIVAARKNLHG